MLKKIVLVFAALALAKAQLPNIGWCPEYVPMADFQLEKFLGVWYEAERYFQLTDVVSRCVATNYTRGPDGKVRVSNEVTNRFTGIKRILEGEIKPAASKSEEPHFKVKYTSVPLSPETSYDVLETDYENYAVLWSCSGIGPIHAQNAWLMTRQRVATPETMQKAYGVLDKYQIWKRYFVKTDQKDCVYGGSETAAVTPKPAAEPAPAPAPASASAPAPAAAPAPVKEEPAVVPAQKSAEAIYLRSASILEEAAKVDETRKEDTELPVKAADPIVEKPAEEKPVAVEEKPAAAEEKLEPLPVKAEPIPEVILKVAESAKDTPVAEAPLPVAEESKIAEVVVPAEPKPEIIAAEPVAEEPKPKIAPVEEVKPVEAPVATEEPKPIEAIPALRSPLAAEVEAPLAAEPIVAEKIEAPAPVAPVVEAIALKSVEEAKTPEPTLVKAEELPKADEEPKKELPAASEPEKISPEAAVLPENIPEPVVKEALAVPAETPVATAQESKKPEVIVADAPKTPEAKP